MTIAPNFTVRLDDHEMFILLDALEWKFNRMDNGKKRDERVKLHDYLTKIYEGR